MRKNKIKKKKKRKIGSHHIQISYAFCCSTQDLAHKQCNRIIKGWLHCLALESKERFLVNDMSRHGSARIFFNKKNKD